jgi:hypothetical protein
MAEFVSNLKAKGLQAAEKAPSAALRRKVQILAYW